MAPKLLVLTPRHPATTPRGSSRIVSAPKLLVWVPRHPANTERVVTYESQWCRNYSFECHDTPPRPRGSSLTNRNGAKTITIMTTTPRVHCKGRHFSRRDVKIFKSCRNWPKPVVLASRHPASTVRVTIFWHHDVKMAPKLLVSSPRHPANTEKVVTVGVATKPTKLPKLL